MEEIICFLGIPLILAYILLMDAVYQAFEICISESAEAAKV